MRTYPITYHDRRGVEKAIIKSDGSTMFLKLRGIDFEGNDFEALNGKIDYSKFDYEFAKGGKGDLFYFRMDIQFPILLFDKLKGNTFTETLHCSIEVGQSNDIDGLDSVINKVKLTTSFGKFAINKKLDLFESALITLQKQLSENIYIKTCLSCKYSNYHPVGNGMFGGLCCFKKMKSQLKKAKDKYDLMDLLSEEAFRNQDLFFVQETFDCSEHQLPTKEDWFYKDWTKLID